MSLSPPRLSFDSAGAAWSEDYGDVYSSRDGALGQARAVFLAGSQLPQRWRGRAQFVIVETGFGLGSNFLAAWQAWRDDAGRAQRLHFVSLEAHPVFAEALRHAAEGKMPDLAAALAAAWPPATSGLHRLEFEHGRVVLTLAFGDARTLLPRLRVGADAFFLDGFAPDRNPALWEPELLKALARCARPQATVATWCTARRVREALAAAGFEVELAPGFGAKRERLQGRFAPRWALRRHEPDAPWTGERRAMVVGAGLAGCASAEALARRGWQVELIDAVGVAGATSALPWGLLHPHFAVDDNRLARLTRAGCSATLAALARLDAQGNGIDAPLWHAGGVFQLARNPEEAERWQLALARLAWPHAWCRWLDAGAAAAVVGLAPCGPGLWWPRGAVVSAARWCAAMSTASPNIRVSLARATRLQRAADGWRVLDADGVALACAPIVVVACGLDAPRLLGIDDAPLRAVRGRIAQLEAAPFASLRAPIAGIGHLLRAPDGSVTVGSTYEEEGTGAAALAADATLASNLGRLPRLLAQPPSTGATVAFDGVRAVARDRLPLAGPIADETSARDRGPALRGAPLHALPRAAGAYGLFALGSRGLTLAPLLAELIAGQIEGEPWPIERDLAEAVDPARFLHAALRRSR